jgi:hypothetical protein
MIFSYVGVTGGERRSRSSVERDDDLAVGAALVGVRERLEGLVEWEGLAEIGRRWPAS